MDAAMRARLDFELEHGTTSRVAMDDARTSLVMISEIAYATGQLLPVREITRAAHRVGAAVVIDGAQTVGHIPIDVHSLGVDAYAIPGQKWLGGPRGIGALLIDWLIVGAAFYALTIVFFIVAAVLAVDRDPIAPEP
jgi:selenocysteine lyase/cysteine desulfurase